MNHRSSPTLTPESQLLLKSSKSFAEGDILWVHAPKDKLLHQWRPHTQRHFSWQLDHHEKACTILASAHCEIGLYPTLISNPRHIVLFAAKSKPWFEALTNAILCSAHHTTMWLVGAKNHGTNSLAKGLNQRCEKHGLHLNMTKVASGRRCQLYCGELREGYEPTHHQAPLSREQVASYRYELATANGHLRIYSLPGVFSASHLDEGTKTLINHLPAWTQSKRVVDFGCGAGVIGAWILKNNPAHRVTSLDIDARAVASTNATFEENQLTGHAVLASSLTKLAQPADIIVSNPPFHDGFDKNLNTTKAFIADAASNLRSRQGELWLVANRFLPYEGHLKKHFRSVKRVATTNKFTVWQASNHPKLCKKNRFDNCLQQQHTPEATPPLIKPSPSPDIS